MLSEVGPVAQDLVAKVTFCLACMQMTMCSQVSQMLVAGTTDVTLEPLLVIQFDAHIVVIVVYKGGCLWGEFSFDGRW